MLNKREKILKFFIGLIAIWIIIMEVFFTLIYPSIILSDWGLLFSFEIWLTVVLMVFLALKLFICLFEISFMKNTFPYMYNHIGRSLYIIILGTLLLNNDWSFSTFTGISVIACGLILLSATKYFNK